MKTWTTTNKCNIGRGKKRRNLPNWLCFTAKRNEDYSIQRLRHVMASRQSSPSMTSYPQQIAVPFAVFFGGFWRPSPPKIQGCQIDQQIQRWSRDHLQDSIANKGMAWPSRHATRKLDDSPQHRNISSNTKQFNVQRLMFRKAIRPNATPFVSTLYHSTLRWAISRNATLFIRCTFRHYAEPFHTTLHHMCLRCTILYYAVPFDATLHRLCVRCATRHYHVPFDATQHRLCTVLQMSAKLFAIELVHFTISCSNSTWATRPFIIWLNYPCLGWSVSRRKTKPFIIWPCYSFISYSILQLIYLTSLYFWWWRSPKLKAASWNWNWVWHANIFLHESPNVTVKCRTTKQCRSLAMERFVLF